MLLTLSSPQDDSGAGAGLGTSSANVNRYIQQLAQEYSGDCKTSFDELSKIIQVRAVGIFTVSFLSRVQSRLNMSQ